jgi:hypothetical protein
MKAPISVRRLRCLKAVLVTTSMTQFPFHLPEATILKTKATSAGDLFLISVESTLERTRSFEIVRFDAVGRQPCECGCSQ